MPKRVTIIAGLSNFQPGFFFSFFFLSSNDYEFCKTFVKKTLDLLAVGIKSLIVGQIKIASFGFAGLEIG
jgi:hypothetical protein